MMTLRTLTLAATGVVAFAMPAAQAAPASDPPLPALVEPHQTQSPSAYAARREALMKAMGDGVAVVYAEGEDDAAGYRQSSDFFYLTGVVERGAILLLANRDPEAER